MTHTFITQHIWGRSWDNDVVALRVHMATLRKKKTNADPYRSKITTRKTGGHDYNFSNKDFRTEKLVSSCLDSSGVNFANFSEKF